jgi:hypothetical protein
VRCKTAAVTYHEAYWTVIGAGAPVVVLADILVLRDAVQASMGGSTWSQVGAMAPGVVIAGLAALAFGLSLDSLLYTHDVLPNLAAGLLTVAMAFLVPYTGLVRPRLAISDADAGELLDQLAPGHRRPLLPSR